MQGSNIYIYPKNIIGSNGSRFENVGDDSKKRGNIELFGSMNSGNTNFFLDLIVGHLKRLLVAGHGYTGYYKTKLEIKARREGISWVVCGNGVVQLDWLIALFIGF